MRKIELDELKQLQLQILDEVVDFCNQHQIKYFLMAGTLLGAVRHQGYIPWDDDIDIGMLREDYERFLELYSKKEGNYYIYTHKLNPKSTFPFMKLCLKDTLVREEFLDSHDEYGINIDIFPIDSISSQNSIKIVKNINLLLKIRHIKSANLIKYWQEKDKLFPIRTILKIIFSFISYKTIFNKIDVILQKEAKQTEIYKGNILWGYGTRELVDPKIFDSLTEVTFEGKQYKIPMNYHNWLTNVYGNYMELPPIEKRMPHHFMSAYVLNSE